MRNSYTLSLLFICLFNYSCSLLVPVKDPPANNGNNLTCGDGVRQSPEACDGADLGGQTCETLGFDPITGDLLLCRTDCTFDTSGCGDGPVCGDGTATGGEDCDSDDLGGKSCQTLGFTDGNLACADCTFDTSGCVSLGCGNGAIDGTEECDGPELNDQSCLLFGFAGGDLTCDNCKFNFQNCLPTELTNVSKVVTGDSHTCALTHDGLVFCWGMNSHGQIGQTQNWGFYPTPVPVGELSPASDLVAGNNHTCALTHEGSDDKVFCWGDNSSGQVGLNPIGGLTFTPQQVQGVDYPAALAAGSSHTCARQAGGTMVCWGANTWGQLGDSSTTTATASPVTVLGLTGLLQISAGGSTTCATTTAFDAYCWGMNTSGQVGNNTTTEARSPVRVYDSFLANYITTGGDHTCAIGSSGGNFGVFCWGSNDFGQLGVGETNPAMIPIPTQVSGFSGNFIEAGPLSTCSGTSTNLYCWGRNDHGQLGLGTDTSPITSPAEVSFTGEPYTQVSQPRMHTCAVTTSKSVRCWGFNDVGQLGDGTRDEQFFSVQVGN